MNPIKPSGDLSREDAVSLCLRQCALVVDPRYGRLSKLAEEFELHETTLGLWIRNGRIPRKSCRKLERRFGKKLVKFDFLVDA
jgi:hypothetical protein